ncbi:caspase domain-containing protein [Xylaria scruposa]|nr:caspase domain-containing protein [Xylaria scruposa]
MDSHTPIYDISKTCDCLFSEIISKPDAASAFVAEVLHQRFKQWASYLGVFAQENISLDARLRHSESISQLVLQYLQVASRNLDRIGRLDESLKAENSVGEDLQRIVLEGVDHAPEVGASSPLVESLRALKMAIDGLYRLGVAIRQSSSRTLHRRITNFAEENKDVAIEDLVFFRLKHKFIDERPKEGNIKSPLSLYRQLAISISYRYFEILYRRNRQKTLEVNRMDAPAQPRVEYTVLEQNPKESITSQNPAKLNEKGCPSELRKSAVANVIMKQQPERSQGAPTTVNTSSVLQKYAATGKDFPAPKSVLSAHIKDAKYPDPPIVDLRTRQARCPFCGRPISEVDLKRKNWWHDHFEQDLKLYTCISETCVEPPQLFVRFHEWRQHMDEKHSTDWMSEIHKPLGWCCDIEHDDKNFNNEDEYDQHVQEIHPGNESERFELKKWSELQRKRPPYICPICNCVPEELANIFPELRQSKLDDLAAIAEVTLRVQSKRARDKLLLHIGTHLKQLGLMSVEYLEDNADDSSMGSKSGTVTTNKDGKLLLVEDPQDYLDPEFKDYIVPPEPKLLEGGDVDWSRVKYLGVENACTEDGHDFGLQQFYTSTASLQGYQGKWALLIGIDCYDSHILPDISGCVKDVGLIETYLEKLVGISNITKLTSPSTSRTQASSPAYLPTCQNVVAALEELATKVQKNDFVYIHFSGHGTRLSTMFPWLNCNAEDEALVLVREDLSEHNGRVDILRDLEFTYLLRQIADKGAAITVVMDCCHSGGLVYKHEPLVIDGVESLPEDALATRSPIRKHSVLEWLRSHHTASGTSGVSHWLTFRGIGFLAACRANQKANGTMFGGRACRGLLTECLLSVLQDHSTHLKSLTCGMIYNLVSRKVTSHPKSTHRQDVVFRGDRHRVFFGTVRNASNKTTITRITRLANKEFQIDLSAGKADGVTEADFYAIYSPERTFTSLMDYISPSAVCKISQIEDFSSTALVEYNVADIGVDWKAVRVRQSLGALEKLMYECELIRLDDSGPFFTISSQFDRFKISFTLDGNEATVNAQSEATLLSYLRHLSIYYNLLDLTTASGHNGGLSVEKLGYLPHRVKVPGPFNYDPNAPLRVDGLRSLVRSDPQVIHENDRIVIQVRNKTHRTLFIEIIDLDPSWEATRVYPIEGNAPIELLPGEATNFFLEMSMSMSVPDTVQPSQIDTVIVLATANERENFPVKVLPTLSNTPIPSNTPTPSNPPVWHGPPLKEVKNTRGAKGFDLTQWYARRVDVRVVR